MSDRCNQPATLRKKIERLEAQLAAEKQAHNKTFQVYREQLYEVVDLRLRVERATKALQGVDE